MAIRFMKKSIFLIPTVMLIAVGIVMILAWVALKPISAKTGFSRNFTFESLKQINAIDKPKDVYEIAGNTAYNIFYKTKNPNKLYETDILLQKTSYISLNVPYDKKVNSRFTYAVDSPNIYLLAGNLPGIIKTKPQDSFIIYHVPNSIFTRTALISQNTFALRIFDKLNQIFIKSNILTGQMIKENNVSEKSNDGGISTDGMLLYDKESNLLAYVHYFRNEILFLDTNLNLVKTIKTIDKNSAELVKAEQISSGAAITNLAPKRLLNASACFTGGYLFNNSRVKADNEEPAKFNHNSPIDIYNVKTGSLEGSFYIPFYKQEPLISFKIINKKIIALYKNYLVLYDLPTTIKNKLR